MKTRWASEFGWGVEFGWREKNAPGPQTEDSRERGFVSDANDDNRGRSDGLDPDAVGDIADHRTSGADKRRLRDRQDRGHPSGAGGQASIWLAVDLCDANQPVWAG